MDSRSRSLDFRNETLDLSILPRVRQCVSNTLRKSSELFRFHDRSPRARRVDAMASAATLPVSRRCLTGGLSISLNAVASATAAGGRRCGRVRQRSLARRARVGRPECNLRRSQSFGDIGTRRRLSEMTPLR